MTGVEGLEARRRPGERSRVRLGAQRNRRVAGSEGGFHRCREFGLLHLRAIRRPGDSESLAGNLQHAALGDPRPEHLRRRPDAGGEVDAEARHRGLQLRTRRGLECELRIDRARDAGGEKRLLVGLRQFPQRGEGLAVILELHPVEREAGAFVQHRLARRPVRERLVVHPLEGPVGGLAERDVERVRGVSSPEHRARGLENGKIERCGEVLGEMGLDQSATDRAEVVRQPDADTGLFPRLGLAVLRERDGRGDRRSVHVNVVAAGVAVLCPLRHVLGLHESPDDLDAVAVRTDGDDAASDLPIFAPEVGAFVDGVADLAEPRLDPIKLLLGLVGPVGIGEVLDFTLAGLQPVDLGLFVVGRSGRQRMEPAKRRRVFPGDLDHGHGPLPAGREVVRRNLELLQGEALQKHRILEPDSGLVVPREQIAHHRPACGLVGVDADEARAHGCARHAFFRQEPLHLPGRGAIALRGYMFPGHELALAVGGDGEGLQDLQIDLVGPVGVQELGRCVSDSEPLLDDPFGRPEPGGDGGDRLPGRGKLAERLHLVGRMHGYADDVLGERDLFGIGVPGANQARHGVIGRDLAFGGKGLQGSEATSAGDHGMALDAVVAGFGGADNEILEKAERGDRRLDLRIGEGVGRGPSDVLGGEAEQAQRDLPDGWSGHGSESIHCCLHGWVEIERWRASLRPALAAPLPCPAPPPAGVGTSRR